MKGKKNVSRLIVGDVEGIDISSYGHSNDFKRYYTPTLDEDVQQNAFAGLPYPDDSFAQVIIGNNSIASPAAKLVLQQELARICKGEIVLTPPAQQIFGWVAPPAVFTPPKNPTLRVLVLSYMFPSEREKVNGIFVYDQVKALMENPEIDVRVVSGKAFWMNGGPFRILKGQKSYGNAIMNIKAQLPETGWKPYRGVPVTYVPYRVHRLLQLFSLQSDSYKRTIMQVMDEVHETFPFDIVHAHTSFLDGNAAKEISEKFGVPYVITEHTGPFTMLLRTPRMKEQTLGAIGSASAVWGVSESQKEIIQSYFPAPEDASVQEKIGVMYNGIEENRFNVIKSKNISKRINIMFIGYLVPVKNIHLLIEAFSRISKDNPKLHLHLVGGGELEGKLKKQAAATLNPEKIHFMGAVDPSNIPDIISGKCDIMVLPSKSESFGMVVAEATACGKPCVISKCGGAECVVIDESIGEVCEVGDVDSLENALRVAVQNVEENVYDPEYISKYTKEKFGSKAVSRKLFSEYMQVKNSAPQGEAT